MIWRDHCNEDEGILEMGTMGQMAIMGRMEMERMGMERIAMVLQRVQRKTRKTPLRQLLSGLFPVFNLDYRFLQIKFAANIGKKHPFEFIGDYYFQVNFFVEVFE